MVKKVKSSSFEHNWCNEKAIRIWSKPPSVCKPPYMEPTSNQSPRIKPSKLWQGEGLDVVPSATRTQLPLNNTSLHKLSLSRVSPYKGLPNRELLYREPPNREPLDITLRDWTSSDES